MTFKKSVKCNICIDYFLNNDPDHNKEGKHRQHTTLTTLHAINLHKCIVFNMLLNNGGNCQSGAIENLMRMYKRIVNCKTL